MTWPPVSTIRPTALFNIEQHCTCLYCAALHMSQSFSSLQSQAEEAAAAFQAGYNSAIHLYDDDLRTRDTMPCFKKHCQQLALSFKSSSCCKLSLLSKSLQAICFTHTQKTYHKSYKTAWKGLELASACSSWPHKAPSRHNVVLKSNHSQRAQYASSLL